MEGGKTANYWPGFVDALTNVVIAMVFVMPTINAPTPVLAWLWTSTVAASSSVIQITMESPMPMTYVPTRQPVYPWTSKVAAPPSGIVMVMA